MYFIHSIILPFLFILFVYLLHKKNYDGWLLDVLKLFGLGFVFGLLINFIMGIVNSFFVGIAYPPTVAVKLFINYSIFFSALYLVSYYFIVNYLIETGNLLDKVLLFTFNFSYLSGVFSYLNIVQVFNIEIPNIPFYQVSSISFILLVSIILGVVSINFLEALDFKGKGLYFGLNFLILSILMVSYHYLLFFNSYFSLFTILLLFVIIFVFYLDEINSLFFKVKKRG